MLFKCWASVKDGGPTLEQHWVNASFLLGRLSFIVTSNRLVINDDWQTSVRLLNHNFPSRQLIRDAIRPFFN